MSSCAVKPISELTPEVARENWLIFVFGEVEVTEASGPIDGREFRRWWSKPSWWRVQNYKPGCYICSEGQLSMSDRGRLTHFMIPPTPVTNEEGLEG